MKQVQFHGKAGIIGKRTERIDGGMNDDAGKQASASIRNRDQQEADRNCKGDLVQVIYKIHAAAVEQVDDMPDAESHAGDNNGRLDIVLCDGRKQEAPENHFLQESNAEHTHNPADRFRRRIIEGNTVPEISRSQDKQRHIIKEPPGRNRGFTKPVSLLQIVLSDKGEKNNGL